MNGHTISVDARVGQAEVKKLSAKTQQELKAQLEALLEQTPEEQELNKLLQESIGVEQLMLREVKLKDAIIQYVSNAEKMQKQMSAVIEQASLATAQLVRENNERTANQLTAEKMKELLRANNNLQQINNLKSVAELVNRGFLEMKNSVTNLLLQQQTAQANKLNFLILLLIANMILTVTF